MARVFKTLLMITCVAFLIVVAAAYYSSLRDVEPDATKAPAPEYVQQLKSDVMQYHFTRNNEISNQQKVATYDALLAYANTTLQLNCDLTALRFTDGDTADELDATWLTLSYDDPYDLGALFCQLSDFALPYWLCAGLEQLALQNAELIEKPIQPYPQAEIADALAALPGDNMPPFCDAWFTPMLAPAKPDERALRLAVTFADNLLKAGELPALLRQLHQSETYDHEAALLKQLGAEPLPFGYLDVDSTLFFTCATDSAWYYYNEPIRWTWRKVTKDIAYCEKSIAFVKDALGIDYNEPLSYSFFPSDPEDHGFDFGYDFTDELGNIFLFSMRFEPPTAAAHEAVHALAIACDLSSNNTSNLMDEGLASAIEFDFEQQEKGEYYLSAEGYINDFTSGAYYSDKLFDAQLSRYVKRQRADDKPLLPVDMQAYNDAEAAVEFAYKEHVSPITDEQHQWDIDNELAFPDDMYSYAKAGSFVHYLVDTYGLPKVKLVYYNNTTETDHFGKDWETLIDEWKSQLMAA